MKRLYCLLFLLCAFALVHGQAQVRHKKLYCVVRNTTGVALRHASAYLVKAGIKTKADSNGKIRMVYPLGGDTLVISCTGYDTRKIFIPYDVNQLNVTLKPH
jgi:hypothetical protein